MCAFLSPKWDKTHIITSPVALKQNGWMDMGKLLPNVFWKQTSLTQKTVNVYIYIHAYIAMQYTQMK